MTDISNWHDCIHIMKVQARNVWTGKAEDGHHHEYLVVPLNEYQMGNLIDAIAQVSDTGDWYGEFCDIIAAAMRFQGLKELRSNNGRTFTLEQVEARNIRAVAP